MIACVIAACGVPDPDVESGRSDRTRDDASPATTISDPTDTEPTDTEPTDTEPAEPDTTDAADTVPEPGPTEAETTVPATDPPADTEPTDTTPPDSTAPERPPAPAADGPGSVSADDLDSVFLPTNPDLLGPSSILTDGRTPQVFLDEYMTFTGMDPVMEIAGAPITLAWLILSNPVFDDDGNLTSASRFRARHRFAVQYDPEPDGDLDPPAKAEALRDELRPFIEAAYPGQEVRDTFNDEVIDLQAFGLAVGPENNPTMFLDIQQHYFIVPRPVNEPLLAINVSRFVSGDDLVLSEVPNYDVFVDDDFQRQLDLFEAVPTEGGTPAPSTQAILRSIPSAGTQLITPSIRYDITVLGDDFTDYVDGFAAAVEPDGYDAAENFGNIRTFELEDGNDTSSFDVEREGDDVSIIIVGDRAVYPK